MLCRSNNFGAEAEDNVLRLTSGDCGLLLGQVCDGQGRVLYNILRLVGFHIILILQSLTPGLTTMGALHLKMRRSVGVPSISAPVFLVSSY